MANILNGVNKLRDFTTTYNLADGDTDLIVPITQRSSVYVEVVAGAFDYPASTSNGTNLAGTLDATVDFNQSSDGVNSQGVANATQLVLDAATKSGGWYMDIFEAENAHITIVQNNVSAGTVRVLVTIKPVAQ